MSGSANDNAFSSWPDKKSIQATSPWPIIRKQITKNVKNDTNTDKRHYILAAYIDQAEFFYKSTIHADNLASKSLLLYYFALNLVKAYIIFKDPSVKYLNGFSHGLLDNYRTQGETYDIEKAELKFEKPDNHTIRTFDYFAKTIGSPTYGQKLPIKDLLKQIVIGHRLWASSRPNREEHFIRVVSFQIDRPQSISVHTNSKINRDIDKVFTGKIKSSATKYQNNRIDISITEEKDASKFDIKKFIWPVVTTESPFRAYYLATTKLESHLNPLVSCYALMFHLGSIARYKPFLFNDIIESDDSAQIVEFLNCIPSQFLYLLSSEIIERDIERPAIL